MPARVLVPLRPAPATKRTFRGTPSGFISSMALGCSVTAGSLPASRSPARVLGSSPMKRLFSRAPLLGVVIPAWGVEDYLDDCMRSLSPRRTGAGRRSSSTTASTDRTGEIADAWARRDNRISVVHSVNGGLGAARNLGVQHVRGDYLAFLDSDDVLPPTAYADLVGALDDSGSDFATGSIVRWEGDRPGRAAVDAAAAPAPARCAGRGPARDPRRRLRLEQGVAPLLLGRRRAVAGPRACATRTSPPRRASFLDGSFDVLDEVVYRWRIREGSITQTRASSLQDLADRWETKRMSLASVRDARVGRGRGGLRRPGAGRRPLALLPAGARVHADEWWRLLRAGVLELWGQRSLVHSGLPPVHRLAGWLVEQDRRADVTALMEWVATLDGPAPRAQDVATGAWRLVGAALGARRDDRGSRSAGAAGPRGTRWFGGRAASSRPTGRS